MKSKAKNNGYKFICVPSTTGPFIIPYKIERSPRLKRMSMQINCAQFVTLKMPIRHSEVRGTQFLQEHGKWIRQTMAAQPRVPRLKHYLMRNPRVALAGRWYQLEMGFRKGICRYLISDRERRIVFTLDPRGSTENQMISLLRDIARESLPLRLHQFAEKVGVKVHGITVRDQKCRWGSCSETGAISLNWRLVLIPPALQDHVLLHELAHLRYFDHSPAFYRFLNSLDPRAREHARKLDGDASRIINLGREEA